MRWDESEQSHSDIAGGWEEDGLFAALEMEDWDL